MDTIEETDRHIIAFSGNQSVISRRTAIQIVSRHPVYAQLRREVTEGIGRTIPMYAVLAAGEGYVAQRSSGIVMEPVESEGDLMRVVGQGIVADNDNFIPHLGVRVNSDGVETLFFWLDTRGPPPERMVALDASERPEQIGPDAAAKGPLIGVKGDSQLVNLLMKQVGSAFVFKHHCLLCKRPVSGRNRCARCRLAVYCDAECQWADWRRHRAECCARGAE